MIMNVLATMSLMLFFAFSLVTFASGFLPLIVTRPISVVPRAHPSKAASDEDEYDKLQRYGQFFARLSS